MKPEEKSDSLQTHPHLQKGSVLNIEKLTNKLFEELTDRLNRGENLAFIEQNDDDSVNLTIYGLELINKNGNIPENIVRITEGLIQFSRQEKESIFPIDDTLELTKSTFKLDPTNPHLRGIRKDELSHFSDLISESLASSLRDILAGYDGDRRKSQSPMESISVFLSYSARDRDQAREIENLLIEANIPHFLDEKSIDPGRIWRNEIKNALKSCIHFWLLVSPNSLTSEWVKTEWGAAWVLDKFIMPIFYRCGPDELPARLKEYQGVDFHQINMAIDRLRR